MFMSDLSRAIDLPVEVDFMAVSSYGSATRTSGVVRIVKDLDVDLADRHVLVVEDIVDSGLTLSYLQRYLLARAPGQPRGLRPAGEGRASSAPSSTSATSGFTSRPSSWWATASTSPSATATSGPSTPTTDAAVAEGVRPPGERRHRPRSSGPSARCSTRIGEDPDRDGLLETPRPGGAGCTRSCSPGSARTRPTISR